MDDNTPLKLSWIQRIVFSSYFEENEKIYYFIQNHWLKYIFVMFKMSLIFLPSLFVLIIWGTSNPYIFLGSLGSTLISACLLLLGWYNLYADAFILTDKNVIFVEWDSLVKIKSSRISYSEIESASVEMEGFFPTLFGYGDIKIETANEQFTPEIKSAANASFAERQILINKERYGRSDGKVEAELLKNAIKGIVDEYILEKKDEKKKDIETTDNLENRFDKYKIRGSRFHQHDDIEKVDKEDLSDDRFEKYRLKKGGNTHDNVDNKDNIVDKRFKRFREKKE